MKIRYFLTDSYIYIIVNGNIIRIIISKVDMERG